MQPIGLNLAPINYWSPPALLDLVKTGSAWKPQWAGNGTVGADGWPVGDTAGEMSILLPLGPVARSYTLIVLEGGVSGVRIISSGKRYPVADNMATFDAVGLDGKGTQINIVPVPGHRVRVAVVRTEWLDLYRAGEKWAPNFLDRITGAPRLRFMDWIQTNGFSPDKPPVLWSSPDIASFSGKMVPIEYIADLCNKVGADCQINIPSNMALEEARRAIVQLRSLLLPWIKLSIEWSNEVWNTAAGFMTGRWIAKTAYPGGWTAYAGKSAAALALSIKDVAGAWVRLAGKWVSPSAMQKVIDAYKAAGGPWEKVCAIDFAPYPWNDKTPVATFLANNDKDGLLAELNANRLKYAPTLKAWAQLGAANGVPAERYEEALSPFPKSPAEEAFCIEALKLPRAGEIIKALWADADAAGCGTGMFYNSAAQGVFGFAPDYDDATGYPQRQAWAGYNLKAWPMSRAVVRVESLRGA